jgi:hypothetical protein
MQKLCESGKASDKEKKMFDDWMVVRALLHDESTERSRARRNSFGFESPVATPLVGRTSKSFFSSFTHRRSDSCRPSQLYVRVATRSVRRRVTNRQRSNRLFWLENDFLSYCEVSNLLSVGFIVPCTFLLCRILAPAM